MNIAECVKDIRNAKLNNRLVVFVGAGVSINSGVPSWTNLVHSMGLEIQYEKSLKINNKEKYEYTSEELLRIPEYLYLENQNKYFSIIKDNLEGEYTPNSIDDSIFSICPHHIITTNYDHLLEESKHVYRNLFSVITKDSALLSQVDQRYLLKMHGDLDDIKEIVLKETDYLEYEQNHPLTTTFIKSLLINHTFLFIGYGLNDNNLNMIISWINYFCKTNEIETRPTNYLIATEKYTTFDIDRLKTRNIEVVQLEDEKEELINAVSFPPDIKEEKGKMLYSFLSTIIDNAAFSSFVPFDELIMINSNCLNGFNRFGMRDFLKVNNFQNCEITATEVHMFDQDRFEKISSAMSNENVQNLFSKAGITKIVCFQEPQKEEIIIPKYNPTTPYFYLYLDNKYIELENALNDCELKECLLYYAVIFDRPKEEIANLIDQLPPDEKLSTPILLMKKIRNRLSLITLTDRQEDISKDIGLLLKLLNEEEKNALNILISIFSGNYDNRSKMNELLVRQEERYFDRYTSMSGHSWFQIMKLQSYVYDAYYFIKENFLPIDYYSDMKNYFSDYIQAIFCSYYPSRKIDDDSNWTHLDPYIINRIDVDIIVKFSNYKTLKRHIEKYKIDTFQFEDDVDLFDLFKNLAESILKYHVYYWYSYLNCLGLLISKSSISPELKQKTVYYLIDVFTTMQPASFQYDSLLEVFLTIISDKTVFDEFDESYGIKLLSYYIDDKEGSRRNYSSRENKLIKHFGMFSNSELTGKCDAIAATLNKEDASLFRFDFRLLYSHSENIDYFSDSYYYLTFNNIVFLLINKDLKFSDEIEECLYNKYEMSYQNHETQKSLFGYSPFDENTNLLLALPDFGIDIDLSRFRRFKDKSDYLQYYFDPKSFDYSKIDLSNYIWENMFRSSRLRAGLIENKEKIISPHIKTILNNETATNAEMKIVYGFLLSKDEMFSKLE